MGAWAKENIYVLEDDLNQKSVLVDSEYKAQSDKKQEEGTRVAPGCKKEMPTLSIGDHLVSSAKQWKDLKKKKLFIASVSDSLCLTCCQDEPLLARFI